MIGDSLSNAELGALRAHLSDALALYGKDIGPVDWAWPGGSATLAESYVFMTPDGLLVVGPMEEQSRWWYGVTLLDEYPESEITPIYEFNVPKTHNNRMSIHFRKVGERGVAALHSGRFTVGTGAVKADTFLDYYDSAPGIWPIVTIDGRDYLNLFTFDLDRFRYSQFYSFITGAAQFADYVTFFKDEIRNERRRG